MEISVQIPERADNRIPDHVPPGLVYDFDYINSDTGVDLLAFWKNVMRDDVPDIFWTPRQGGHWIMKRFDDIAHVFQNYEDFSSRHMIIPVGSTPPNVAPFGLDPPDHTEYRRLLAPFFSPKAISDLEVRSRELTLDLLGKFSGATACEFVESFSKEMPIGIFMNLLDLPEKDQHFLVDIADRAVRSPTACGRVAAYNDFSKYLETIFEERRLKPGSDLLSALLGAELKDGQHMTQEQLLQTGGILLAAGLDTVAGALGLIIYHLARHPELRHRLIEQPQIMPQAVEEFLRLYSVGAPGRVVTHDLEYKGIAMKAGEGVLCLSALAGLDNQHFDNPYVADFDRADKRSLVFGKGPHQCIGAFLARTELKVFLTEWLKRVPDFHIAEGDTPRFATGPSQTVTYLPLAWCVPIS